MCCHPFLAGYGGNRDRAHVVKNKVFITWVFFKILREYAAYVLSLSYLLAVENSKLLTASMVWRSQAWVNFIFALLLYILCYAAWFRTKADCATGRILPSARVFVGLLPPVISVCCPKLNSILGMITRTDFPILPLEMYFHQKIIERKRLL